jgi:hypothetical protein
VTAYLVMAWLLLRHRPFRISFLVDMKVDLEQESYTTLESDFSIRGRGIGIVAEMGHMVP